jgi:hypothetical protein
MKTSGQPTPKPNTPGQNLALLQAASAAWAYYRGRPGELQMNLFAYRRILRDYLALWRCAFFSWEIEEDVISQ